MNIRERRWYIELLLGQGHLDAFSMHMFPSWARGLGGIVVWNSLILRQKNVCQLKTRGYGIDKSPKSDLVMRDGSRKNAVGNTSFSQGNKAIVGDLPG